MKLRCLMLLFASACASTVDETAPLTTCPLNAIADARVRLDHVHDPFTVAALPTATVTTNQSTYSTGQTVLVSWSNTPGNATDWIAIAPSGSPDETVVRWVYTAGQVDGTYGFVGLPAGTYVARVFMNDQYIKLGQSASFTVQ